MYIKVDHKDYVVIKKAEFFLHKNKFFLNSRDFMFQKKLIHVCFFQICLEVGNTCPKVEPLALKAIRETESIRMLEILGGSSVENAVKSRITSIYISWFGNMLKIYTITI